MSHILWKCKKCKYDSASPAARPAAKGVIAGGTTFDSDEPSAGIKVARALAELSVGRLWPPGRALAQGIVAGGLGFEPRLTESESSRVRCSPCRFFQTGTRNTSCRTKSYGGFSNRPALPHPAAPETALAADAPPDRKGGVMTERTTRGTGHRATKAEPGMIRDRVGCAAVLWAHLGRVRVVHHAGAHAARCVRGRRKPLRR
jgi:hypothetical protein